MTDKRVRKFAEILVDYSAEIVPGDRVLLEATTEAAPLIEVLYELILDRGGHPYTLLRFPGQEKYFMTTLTKRN